MTGTTLCGPLDSGFGILSGIRDLGFDKDFGIRNKIRDLIFGIQETGFQD